MARSLFLLAWLAVLAGEGCRRPAHSEGLAIETADGRAELRLPANFHKALMDYKGGFRPWQDSDFAPTVRREYPYSRLEAPFAVIGDFNSDGRLDAAIQGVNGSDYVLLALIDTHGAIEIAELGRGTYTDLERNWIHNETNIGQYVTLQTRPLREATRCRNVAHQDRPGDAILLRFGGNAYQIHYRDQSGAWRKGCGAD